MEREVGDLAMVGGGRRSRARLAAALGLAALLVVPPHAAVARPTLEELREQRREADQQHSQLEAEVEAAERQLDELEAEFSLAVEEYNEAVVRLSDLEARVSQLEDRVEALRAGMEERRTRVGSLVRGLYMSGGAVSGFETLLGSAAETETVQRYGYLRSAQRGQAAVVERYAAERTVLEREQADLDQARAEHAEVVAELDTRRADLEERAEQQAEEIAALEASVAEAREELGQARSAVQFEEQRLARERARERERERERQRQREVARASRSSGQASASSESSNDAPSSSSAGAGAPSAAAQAAVQAALGQVGTRYQWGGSSPSQGFDCSGLIVWSYDQAGVNLWGVRSSRRLYANLPKVSRSDLRPGDLLFFNSPISHASMYIGNGQMVEAPRSGLSVRVRSIERRGYRGAVRPTG